jgi:2-polyprenyl-3-methyl-5-hydroxy-6-metoxy-1,4-benzoquinol methylase
MLDIGCGHGYMSFALASLMKLKGLNAKMLSIDIHKQCIQKSINIQNIHFPDTK